MLHTLRGLRDSQICALLAGHFSVRLRNSATTIDATGSRDPWKRTFIPMALHEIIYVSLASQEMAAPELTTLLETARLNNMAHGITGMMFYRRREFLQLIEGDLADIQALYDKIQDDPRHTQIFQMWEGPIPNRNFSQWSMAFASSDDLDLAGKPGYATLLNDGLSAAAGSTGKKLLLRLRDDFLSEP
jgi:hypothetical protein